MKKIRVAVLFGGRSAEHEVSLQSAKSVVEALDKEKYEVLLIGIDKKGKWLLNNQSQHLLQNQNTRMLSIHSDKEIAVLPGSPTSQMIDISSAQNINAVDVVFPLLHGTYGEDGAIQGLLKMLDVAFVGADILGSAVGMDKDVMKRLLREAEIPIGKCIVLKQNETLSFSQAKKQLGLPLFVKPANLGSSVGINKVHNEKEYRDALSDAFQYDTKILIEEFIDGKEIECSVLGNEKPEASLPGEIVTHHTFYSYESKYTDAEVIIPAKLSKKVTKEIQQTAIKTFQTLCCMGMARVDFFVTKEDKVYVNELNTIPGFTKLSVYPKLWEATGISYPELLDRLITFAIAYHENKKKLKTSFV